MAVADTLQKKAATATTYARPVTFTPTQQQQQQHNNHCSRGIGNCVAAAVAAALALAAAALATAAATALQPAAGLHAKRASPWH